MIIHYMDDILIAGPTVSSIHLQQLTTDLLQYGLHIAPEKIRKQSPYSYLGRKFPTTQSIPCLPQDIYLSL